MGVNILTSGFPEGFPYEIGIELQTQVIKRNSFVFLASEFNSLHEKTDKYCNQIIKMFLAYEIYFEHIQVIDSRIPAKTAQQIIQSADVLWISGGNAPSQYNYIKLYGLIPFVRERKGLTIGMSAGSINMAKTAICTLSCGNERLEIYEGLGLVEISVEPHFDGSNITDEVLQLSNEYTIYGMCDNSAIIIDENKVSYLGDIYKVNKENIEQISRLC